MKSSTSVVELVMLLCSQVRLFLALIVLVSSHSDILLNFEFVILAYFFLSFFLFEYDASTNVISHTFLYSVISWYML